MAPIDRVAACLGERNGTLEFLESPMPALRRLLTMEPAEQAEAVRAIAEFGLFLEKEKGAPEAAALLLESLESVSKQILARRVP